MQPGLTLNELSSVFNMEQTVLQAHLEKLRQDDLLQITNGKYFIK